MRRPHIVRTSLALLVLAELLAIVGVGKLVGFWWTLGLLVLGGVVGACLIASGGRRAFDGLRRTLEVGDAPDKRVANAVLTVAGGVLLMVPGFITDVVGLVFVLPPTRRIARILLGVVAARTAGRIAFSVQAAGVQAGGPGSGLGAMGGGPVVPTDVIRTTDSLD